jgi:hypothetical protein
MIPSLIKVQYKYHKFYLLVPEALDEVRKHHYNPRALLRSSLCTAINSDRMYFSSARSENFETQHGSLWYAPFEYQSLHPGTGASIIVVKGVFHHTLYASRLDTRTEIEARRG